MSMNLDKPVEELTTKEKIVNVAIDLFSQKGYDKVSIREITRTVGIRESSLYNHFKSKEEIMDTIFDYFLSQLAGENPEEFKAETAFDVLGLDSYFYEGARSYLERMKKPSVLKIWRIITIEVYHNDKIRNFFIKEMLESPLRSWERVFTVLIQKKLIKPLDPKVLANEYFSFTVFLFFEYYVLRYDTENVDTFMDFAIIKMNEHTKFMLDAIRA